MSLDNNELLQIALKTAELAQTNILKYFQSGVGVEWKKDNTPVTIADKSTEELAREFWAKETPGFGVIGEELRNTSGSSTRLTVPRPSCMESRCSVRLSRSTRRTFLYVPLSAFRR